MPEDLFEKAYTAGALEDVEPPPQQRELLSRAAPGEPIALGGCVLTPDRAIKKGYVVVSGKTISAVSEKKPQGVKVHETGGVILPGLIDLHGHPEFNIFAAWEPPRRYDNRYAWRGDDLYHKLVRDPQNVLLKELPRRTQLRYAEIRALVGGATAIQGASGKIRGTEEALVRNIDLWIFGAQVGRTMIDLPDESSRDFPRLQGILDKIKNGEVKALYVHLAEGRSDNPRSVKELDKLIELKALTPATVVIHGTALSGGQLQTIKDAGAKLVWSPQSNLRLYQETTQAAEAINRGLLVGLGADWLPSGSTSLLAEMKVARRCLAEQGLEIEPKKLVQMVTCDAAEIAGLQDKMGTLAKDRPADLLVLERREDDPWENVAQADPSSVELVMIDGDLAYGRADWLGEWSDPDDRDRLESLIAWGKHMSLDTSYTVDPGAEAPPMLEQLRADLISKYPEVGPIFA
jgi:5-methylthioadenosine/S-adenosylhomocysteine deaminase